MNEDGKSHITLENLLRLKRVEKPPAEFWTQFENDLRAKQLAAIMEKRPWWAGFSKVFGNVSRFQVPLGAAAALAVTFAGFHEYRAYASRSRVVPAVQVAFDVPAPKAEASLNDASAISDEAVVEPKAPVALTQAVATPVRATEVQTLPSAVSLAANPVSMRNDFAADWSGAHSTSSHTVDLTITSAGISDNELVPNVFAGVKSRPTGLIAVRRPVAEPLEQMTSPNEERRSRLLGEALPVMAHSADTAEPANDRFVNRLDDDRMYRSISRYGVGGDNLSLTVKF